MKQRKMTWRLTDALALLAKYGFTHCHVREWENELNRLVTLHQDWLPKGDEYVSIRKAMGKWKGNSIGSAFRKKPA